MGSIVDNVKTLQVFSSGTGNDNEGINLLQ